MNWETVLDNIIDIGSYIVVAIMVLALPVGIVTMIVIWLINLL